jgi:hypothetical protein
MFRVAEGSWANRLLATLLLIALLAVLAPVALAQSDAGRITGTVTDASGAVVSGANVSATNLGTGRVVTVQSGGAGEFSMPTLQPGHYKVEVQAPNFKAATQDVTLQVGQVLPLTFTLATGATTENVEVTSAAPMVASQSSDSGAVLVGRQVVDLPLTGRPFTQLATLVPGVRRGANINSNAAGTQGNA